MVRSDPLARSGEHAIPTGSPRPDRTAIQKTGLIVTDANRHLLSDADLEEWQAAVEEGKEIHGAVDQTRSSGQRGTPKKVRRGHRAGDKRAATQPQLRTKP